MVTVNRLLTPILLTTQLITLIQAIFKRRCLPAILAQMLPITYFSSTYHTFLPFPLTDDHPDLAHIEWALCLGNLKPIFSALIIEVFLAWLSMDHRLYESASVLIMDQCARGWHSILTFFICTVTVGHLWVEHTVLVDPLAHLVDKIHIRDTVRCCIRFLETLVFLLTKQLNETWFFLAFWAGVFLSEIILVELCLLSLVFRLLGLDSFVNILDLFHVVTMERWSGFLCSLMLVESVVFFKTP